MFSASWWVIVRISLERERENPIVYSFTIESASRSESVESIIRNLHIGSIVLNRPDIQAVEINRAESNVIARRVSPPLCSSSNVGASCIVRVQCAHRTPFSASLCENINWSSFDYHQQERQCKQSDRNKEPLSLRIVSSDFEQTWTGSKPSPPFIKIKI